MVVDQILITYPSRESVERSLENLHVNIGA